MREDIYKLQQEAEALQTIKNPIATLQTEIDALEPAVQRLAEACEEARKINREMNALFDDAKLIDRAGQKLLTEAGQLADECKTKSDVDTIRQKVALAGQPLADLRAVYQQVQTANSALAKLAQEQSNDSDAVTTGVTLFGRAKALRTQVVKIFNELNKKYAATPTGTTTEALPLRLKLAQLTPRLLSIRTLNLKPEIDALRRRLKPLLKKLVEPPRVFRRLF